MPFLDDTTGSAGLALNPVLPEQVDRDFLTETVPAAFRIENTVGAAMADDTWVPFGQEADADFDPIRLVPEGYEDYAEDYAFANSPFEVNRITKRIDRELEDRQMLAESGGMGAVATLVAGILDPINLIPIGGTAYRTYRTGGSILRAGATTAAAGAVGMTATEAALHQSQITRTYGESAANIAAGTFLAGVLGASTGAVINRAAAGAGKQVDDILRGVESDLTPSGPASLSAAAARTGTLADEGIKANKAVDATLKLVRGQDPVLRTITSDSIETRRTVQDLSEIPLTLTKNANGEATPVSVERLVKLWNAPLYNSLRDLESLYTKYALGRSKKFGDIAKLGVKRAITRDNRRLSFKQFREEVGKAMRRGDVHEIPEVQAAATMMRKTVFDPLKDAAVELKLLPEDVDVKTAASYLNRAYKLEKLAQPQYRREFIQATTAWLRQRQMESIRELEELKAKKAGGAKLSPEELKLYERAKLDADRLDGELIDIAEQIVRRIEGSPAGRLPYDVTVPSMGGKGMGKNVVGTKGPLKERAFLIPDEMIEPWLEHDIEILAKRYTHSMAPDVELSRKFGSIDLQEQIDNIMREYETKMRSAEGDTAKTDNLVRQRDADIRDIMAMRDRIRGVYKLPDDPTSWAVRAGRSIRQLNYITKLGGMTLSALPDLARPTMVHGFGQVWGDALKPLIGNFKTFKLAAKEVRDMGAAADMLLNSRAHTLADVEDDIARYTALERGIGAMSDTFGMVSLMAPWNAAMRQVAGVISMQRTLRAITAEMAGKISKKELERLRAGGLGADQVRAIAAQIEKHGIESDEMLLPNVNAWDDQAAATAFRAQVSREIDITIVTPGQDMPLMASGSRGEIGRMMLQFKSFAIASTQRVLLAGMQQQDAAALNGLMLSVALGMLSYAAKEIDAGRELSDKPEKWLVEGIDRSGVTGWFFDVNNTVEKLTRGTVGISPLLGMPPASRYASRNAVGALLGPTFGTASAAMAAAGNGSAVLFGDEDWHESDTEAVRRLVPYNNLLLFRQMVDQAIGGFNKAVGAK